MKTITRRPLCIEDWGRTDYSRALDRQRALLARRLEGRAPDTLVFTEHEPVYTLGLRKGVEKHLLLAEAECVRRGIAVCRTNRGGDITYHGPGQIVGYPVVSLADSRDLHAYLRKLEQVIINTLGCLGLAADRRVGKTGIWLGDRKIAAIGVAVKQWVAYHGFALNVDLDLAPFGDIVPCGIHSGHGAVTSAARELPAPPPAMEETRKLLEANFRDIFQFS